MAKAQETVLEIDLDALAHNYRYLRSKVAPETKFMAVVKAFAYGSDATKIAFKLETLGVDYFSVAYVKEGVALREAGISRPILVLQPQPTNFEAMIESCLEPSIYSPRILRLFLAAAQKLDQKKYPVHLKFNTGLNRLGFCENDVAHIMECLSDRDEIKVEAIFSHLAASDDLDEARFTEGQISSFEKITTAFHPKLGYRPLQHLLNTSGILNYPAAQYDMVRSGIGLYGFGNEAKFDQELKPVATLKTIISQIHRIEPGESVGYNRAFKANGHQVIATLPIGHADGIGRQYGNGATYVFVHDKKAMIIGNVCMDMIMIDITDIECKEGDEVLLFGKGASAENFAATANTISYELLTGISQRVKRVFIGH